MTVVFRRVLLLKLLLLLGKLQISYFFKLRVWLLKLSFDSHWKLGKLIALYDDNKITIDGDTAVSFTEDVQQRFESYGWQVLVVADGDNDTEAIAKAIQEAKAVTDKPTIIKIRTTIGKYLDSLKNHP